MRTRAPRWQIAIVVAGLIAAAGLAGACRRGKPLRIGGDPSAAGPVVAVLPYELSDAARPLPDGAQLCYADGDCVAHVVRECCPSCDPPVVAVNRAAAHAFERYHASHPCPAAEVPCPDDPPCPQEARPAPGVRCERHRCTLAW